MKMWRPTVLVVVLAVLVLAVAAPAVAERRLINITISQRNTTGAEKTDFHLIIVSDANINVTKTWLAIDRGPLQEATAVEGNDTGEVTVKWVVKIPKGAIVTAIVLGWQREYNSFTTNAYFTPKSPTDVPTLGWRVTCCGCVFLTNGYPSRIAFQDLRLLYPTEITLDSLFDQLQGSPMGGTPALVPAGSVPGGTLDDPGKLFVGCYDLNTGDYLIARLDTSFADPEFSGLEATILIGHEHQLPYWLWDDE